MSIKERLGAAGDPAVKPRPTQTRSEPPAGPDPLTKLRIDAQAAMFSRLGSRLFDASLTSERLREYVVEELRTAVSTTEIPLTDAEREGLVTDVVEDILGYGPMQEFLDDDAITEVMVNSTDPIFVERDGVLEQTERRFVSQDHLRRVIERIVSEVGRRIDESSPMVDARLPDGSRVNAIIPPLAVDGPTLTIRKFSRTPFTTEDLIGFGTLTPRLAQFIDACVKAKISMIISGGTGSGKTTLLNVVSSFLPDRERLVTIEDAVELQLQQKHVVRLESRPPNIEGKGEVPIRSLVKNALRMRPDRIIVGEVRGPEALDMLQAMNTGHEGSLTTLHSNSPRDTLSRLETMVLTAGMELPLSAIREQVASAIQMIVHVSRLSDGTRRITHVTEVQGMEGDVIQLSDLHLFDYDAGIDGNGRFLGSIQPTGLRPSFEKRIRSLGIDLPSDLFGSDSGGWDVGR